MRVLLVGSGGREHALGWKLAQSSRVNELISIPGNPGLADLGPVVEGIRAEDIGAIAAMARVQKVDLVVVGPEGPLAAGLVDALDRLGVPAFGPSRAAARLEASKNYAKEVMVRAGVATAESASFTEPEAAREHLDRATTPYVVKADGLAAGKGVLVTDSRAEALAWVEQWLPSGPVVIEEFLDGPEVSVFAVCTERGAVVLEPARDYKRLLDGDQGPNTGGMGSYSPVDLPRGLVNQTLTSVIQPVLDQMEEEGAPFRGFLYAGLVLTAGGPQVLEFNVRLGDPETQAVLPRLESDLIEVLEGATPIWSDMATVNVVLAAAGYPESPVPGAAITGLASIGNDVLVFHAGTRKVGKQILVDGGRVLSVVGTGPTLPDARERAYAAADRISWPGMQRRADIGPEPEPLGQS